MKTIHVGTIKGRDLLLHARRGHQESSQGCGVHRDRKRDKKTRRQADKRACREF